jgi:hypothetical protein
MDPSVAQRTRILVRSLLAGAVLMVVVGVVLALAVSPPLGLVALVGLGDLWVARMIATGRLGPLSHLDPAERAAADPSHNPYARED